MMGEVTQGEEVTHWGHMHGEGHREEKMTISGLIVHPESPHILHTVLDHTV